MEAIGEAPEAGLEPVEAVAEAVVGDDRGDGGKQADRGREQRLAMPGATTARLVLLAPAMAVKARMIPHTVPNSPTKGATEPTVARMFRRSPRWSSSLATAAFMRLARRSRVPARSTTPPRVERRHSSSPAPSTAAVGIFSAPRILWKPSMSLAAQKSRS